MALLKQAGYECDVACDGKQAVEAVLGKFYDLILMDCQMPEMDGFEATRAIRQYEEQQAASGESGRVRIPIIALTANAIKGDRERCLEAGMDDYVTKPLDRELLMKMIASYLSSSNEKVRGSSTKDAADLLDAPKPYPSKPEVQVDDRPAPFNRADLRKRWGSDDVLIERLITKFQRSVAADVRAIETNVAAGDAEKTARLAHGLKGAAAYLEAKRVRDLATRLEQLGREGDLSGAETCLAELRDEVQLCLDYQPNALSTVPEG